MELTMYNDQPPVPPNPEHLQLRTNFIDKLLVLGIAKPVTMEGDDGSVGMYWDNDVLYADVDVDEDGTLSIFTRSRSADIEGFEDKITLDMVTESWVTTWLNAFRSS
jgi:hypothetical protein